MRDIVRSVMPEQPIGYDVPTLNEGDRFRGAWWRKIVRPDLAALPDIEAPDRGASRWHYKPTYDCPAAAGLGSDLSFGR